MIGRYIPPRSPLSEPLQPHNTNATVAPSDTQSVQNDIFDDSLGDIASVDDDDHFPHFDRAIADDDIRDYDHDLADPESDFSDDDGYESEPDQPEQHEIDGDREDDPRFIDQDAWMDAQEEGFEIGPGLARHVDRIGAADGDGIQAVILNNVLQHHELDPAMRHLYTTIAFGKAVGLSNIAAATILEQSTVALNIGKGIEDDALSTPTKISTAMSRLGVHPDDYIERRIVCPNLDCWRLTPYRNLASLESPICGSPLPHSDDFCQTAIYRTDNRVRVPIKVMPFTPLSTWLALFMQDKDFAANLNSWLGEGDWVERQPSRKERPFFTRDSPLDGLSEGSAWRSGFADTRRSVFGDNSYSDDPRDVPGADPDATYKRHSDLVFGLKIVINIDW